MLKDFSYNNETIETVNEGDSSNILVDVDSSNLVFENRVSTIQNRHSSRSKITPIRLGKERKQSPDQQMGRSSVIRNQFGTLQVMCTYTVFWTCRRENNKKYRVSIELADSAKVLDAVKEIIIQLNRAMTQADSNYCLASDPSAYEVYKAKKNGEPKEDYPALDEDQVLYVTGVQALAVIESRISAVQVRTPVFIGMAPIRKTTESSMVSSTMPPFNGSPYKVGSQDLDVYDEQESICWCLKAKRKLRKESENMSNGLTTKLLD